ncbi:MAG TPA: Gfo/Idh/MocA family oxidoreductase [Phycisphaerales bacterium]|nr:Gfo/Idh/MocA family oxidoreductase [Phycisphaerales bacterium]
MIRRLIAALLLPLALHGCAAPGGAPVQTPAYEPRLSARSGPLRVGVIGMVHGHVEGLLWQATQRSDLVIVGVSEPDRALFNRLAAKYKLDPSLYHATPEAMLDAARPEVVSVMSSVADHAEAVEACAPRGVHALVEKPLAYTRADAARIARLARDHRVLVLTNFETSWYASVREAKRLIDEGGRAPLRRMAFRHGHKGPKEIGCSPEFLAWLTDPQENGGGAIVDFGCYGAVLSTWLMNGQRPSTVTAATATLKPALYPRVDDDATIVLTYPGATAVVQASWAWTHDNKEMDLHTERGSVHAAKWNELAVRDENGPPRSVKPPVRPSPLQDEWSYLRAVVRGGCPVDPLSSLEYNVIVAEILDDAREAALRASRARAAMGSSDNRRTDR